MTGAGGQRLYNPEQQDDPASWQEFTFKHISKDHTLTVVEIDGPNPVTPSAHHRGLRGRSVHCQEMT